MDKELQTIFEGLDKEIFTPDLQNQLATVINESVEQKVKDRIELELTQLDESHAEKVKTVLEGLEKTFADYRESVDDDHCKKMMKVKETLEESYGKKLLQVKEMYENVIKKEAITHRNQLVEAISQHLDICLEKAIPAKVVEEAAKNTFVQKQLNEARKVLGVDKEYISENLKQGVLQGKTMLEKLTQENTELKRQNLLEESRRLVAEKTANLPAEQAKFVRTKLSGKSPDFINSNFSFVLEMYNRKDQSDRSALLNENRTTFIVDRSQVVEDEINRTEIISEDVTDPRIAEYLKVMNFKN